MGTPPPLGSATPVENPYIHKGFPLLQSVPIASCSFILVAPTLWSLPFIDIFLTLEDPDMVTILQIPSHEC